MRKTAGVLMLLVFFVPLAFGQKTRFGQQPPFAKAGVNYPIKLHVSAIRIRSDCNPYHAIDPCYDTFYADATLAGGKIELMCGAIYDSSRYQVNLELGDYQARLLKQTDKIPGTPLYDEYELLLHDRRALKCTVSGVAE